MAIKKWIKNKWFRRSLFVLIGALAGFAYYYFIGCTGNACPITSNPYISIGYGSLIGLVLSTGGKQKEKGSDLP
ncbi:MAG: DUF6132 family protein [Candidatus Aminicenantes bacterium]|jgi:hypothetical protein